MKKRKTPGTNCALGAFFAYVFVCFVLSFFYNIIGLYFAVTGQLEPVIAAILMPLSSISIVVFTTVATNIIGRKLE